MAADIDTIIIKFRLYGQLLREPKKREAEGQRDKRRDEEDMRWASVRPEKRKLFY